MVDDFFSNFPFIFDLINSKNPSPLLENSQHPKFKTALFHYTVQENKLRLKETILTCSNKK